ncbi:MAG: bifunctional 5,10-methylene-tetrahydrofolate dehydrogenase/5,10-methylene-tetrahydrofolate cyclohydrolase [Chloroflexi bacterium]|nr:bifunctional 5,10-methylene-tetrahydrofolate dehydrogenase/5,10-methylene-tetrahydrofolate cyclohydrolase [Chloroflexota bacterium]
MRADILDGKLIAEAVHLEVKTEVDEYVNETNKSPTLAVVLVGENPASKSYVTHKEINCKKVGIVPEIFRISNDATELDLIKLITRLNNDETYDGIIVQLPLPAHINEDSVIASISPLKDVDGLTVENLGLLFGGFPRFVPATPLGIMRLLKDARIQTSGKKVVIVGRSKLVGLPLSALLLKRGNDGNATVTVCHTGTKDLQYETKQADILIAAVGQPMVIGETMVKKGTCVIDVGVNRVTDETKVKGFKLVGDVDYENVSKVASLITPVPGGVGPMTVAMLLKNVVKAAKISKKMK